MNEEMSVPTAADPQPQAFAWVKLYHPSGIDVRLPLPTTGTVPVDGFKAVLQSVTNALEAGFTVAIAGAEEGETIETIGHVVRCDVDSRDGGTVPRVDLYVDNDRMRFRIVSVYLNTEAERAAFESVSGMRIRDMTPYVGQGYLERGKSQQTDRLIHRAPHTFRVAFKPNPQHDPDTEAGRMKPARLFTRWPDYKGTHAANGQVEKIDKPQTDTILDKMDRAKGNMDKFLAHFRLQRISDLPKSEYSRVIAQLDSRIAELEAEAAQAAGGIPF